MAIRYVVLTNSAQNPINAYRASKRRIEDILRRFRGRSMAESVIFRYSSVAGASRGEVGEFHRPENGHFEFPLMLDAIDGKNAICAGRFFGTDYDTPDAPASRD